MKKKRKSLSDALTNSMAEEQVKATDRFDKLDTVLANAKKADEAEPEPETAAASKPTAKKTSKTNTRYKSEMKRDGFVMPIDDYQVIQQTMEKLLDQRISANKTQVLRMALHALNSRTPKQLHALFAALDPVAQGRPKGE
ncbi:MAG: hypothetical protein ACI92E_001337 [Oceanicoccus sp.]